MPSLVQQGQSRQVFYDATVTTVTAGSARTLMAQRNVPDSQVLLIHTIMVSCPFSSPAWAVEIATTDPDTRESFTAFFHGQGVATFIPLGYPVRCTGDVQVVLRNNGVGDSTLGGSVAGIIIPREWMSQTLPGWMDPSRGGPF